MKILIVSRTCYLFQINKKEEVESEFNPTFIERLLPKLDWAAIYGAAQVVCVQISLRSSPEIRRPYSSS